MQDSGLLIRLRRLLLCVDNFSFVCATKSDTQQQLSRFPKWRSGPNATGFNSVYSSFSR